MRLTAYRWFERVEGGSGMLFDLENVGKILMVEAWGVGGLLDVEAVSRMETMSLATVVMMVDPPGEPRTSSGCRP